MIHNFIGDLGHLLVLFSFIASLIAIFSYWRSLLAMSPESQQGWRFNAQVSFYLHVGAIVGSAICLFIIIFNHYFEYFYAYSHSSKQLPVHYMISCFWEGQEGSFLLWILWQGLLGIILIHTQKNHEASAMIVFSFIQVFLLSMILGVIIPGLNIKLGSSPFILLRDVVADPIFNLNQNFIPQDGQGLNPLLQNYWMVIHPPTLFLGFAFISIPFSFCIAGLWKQTYESWIKKAIPWVLCSGLTLGAGIVMGGYWAYETLNFGGYWNWDPVENAVYVPWLILIAAIHSMMSYEKEKNSPRLSIILIIITFLLVLYSTFLTRSGVLGDTSVHSFTDLGLSGQLLTYLLFFSLLSVLLIAYRWRKIPAIKKDLSVYSQEFWVLLGISSLCLMGFQVLIPTSIPVYNSFIELLGGSSNLAPPTDQVDFYSRYQLWFGVSLALISGIAQVFWQKKKNMKEVRKELTTPFILAAILFALFISIARIHQFAYMILLFSSIYTIISNAFMLQRIGRINTNFSGGTIAHIGVGLMLIGVLFSSGYSNVVSFNNTGMLISKELPTEFNRDNLLLFVNDPKKMDDYQVTFLGECVELSAKNGYVKKEDIEPTIDPFSVVAKKDVFFKTTQLYEAQDTFKIHPENTFYEIEFQKNDQVVATLFPRVQMNSEMGGSIASPDINRSLWSDLYVYVSLPMNKEAKNQWSEMDTVKVKIGEDFFVNDYVAKIEKMVRLDHVSGLDIGDDDVAVKAVIRVEGERGTKYINPIFLIKNQSQIGRIYDELSTLGIRITLLHIHPDTGYFSLGLTSRQKDWTIIKAIYKPLINLLWLGAGLTLIGLFISIRRSIRKTESTKKPTA